MKKIKDKAVATLLDIARKAGVSTAVVSRILNKDDTLRVSGQTRKRVIQVAEQLDYSPNVAARSLRSAKSDLLALVVHDVTNLVYAEIVRGAQRGAEECQKALLVSDASGSTEKLVDIINGGGLDGIILQATGGVTDEIIVRAAKQNLPIALLQAGLGTSAHLVSLPDMLATRMATTHLLDIGHSKIGCVSTTKGLTFTEQRERGWYDAMHERGFAQLNQWIINSQSTIESGAQATLNLLEQSPELTAIVYCNAMAAIGGLHTIHKKKIRVPEQLSIVTVHDIDICNYTYPPLTAVSMPLFELGKRAVHVVNDPYLLTENSSLIQSPEPSIIVRDSTAPPPSH